MKTKRQITDAMNEIAEIYMLGVDDKTSTSSQRAKLISVFFALDWASRKDKQGIPEGAGIGFSTNAN